MSAKGSFKETSRFDLEGGISNKSTAAGETTLNEHIPHYELPNVSALLYEYTNKEADLIQRCFKTGNYNSLRDLPDEMSAASVMHAQKNKQASNITVKAQPKLIQLMGGGVFSQFEWMPDDYDNFRKQTTKDREDHDEKVKKISSEPWKVGFDSKIEKFKDPFGASGYIFPFFNANDPYEATQDQQLRAKWMKQSKILHGDFKPSLADKSLEKVGRSQLSDMVNFIKKTLLEDWSDTNFLIGTNPDDFIQIKFEQSHADAQAGLHAYMNTLISNHEVISQFNLKKVIQYWGSKIGDYVYFMVSPPWVRTKMVSLVITQTDAYYSLYPEKEPRFAPNLEKVNSALHQSAKKAVLFSSEIQIQ